jgi:dTDP-4-dehydrorhamnose reductase
MNNILVTGSNGQLGSELRALNDSNSIFFYRNKEKLDITNHLEVREFIEENNIKTIINCAAFTAVDKAESELEINERLNHLAVKNFAEIAKEKSIQLIQISTDYIFDGRSNKPYLESDKPNPKSIYGKTKLAGESAMLKINPKNSIIIRTSWVYSNFGNNFVKTMLRLGEERDELGVVSDQVGTPTYAQDLAKAIISILPQIKNDNVELYHYSNEGVCSWYDFSKEIFNLKNIHVKVKPITTSQYPTRAKRPYYSVLNKNKIKERFNIEIPYWKDSLIKCIEKI